MTPLEKFELILVLLTVVVLLSVLATRLRMPPVTTFVLGGLVLAAIPGLPAVELDPELVLVLFLPPLLQASAIQTVWRDFRAALGPILILALGAVVVTTATVGIVAKWVIPDLPWAACFTLGAIVSPPDAVAAKAVLQTLRLPRRLVTVLEGESLLNDASGLVLYRFAAAAALTSGFSAAHAALEFVWLSVGGIGVGLLCGAVTDRLFRFMRLPFHIIMTGFLISWASYIFAERLHASGVLAVVSCGLLLGWRRPRTLSAATRTQTRAVWDIVTLVLEALVFILIGLSLRGVIERVDIDRPTLGITITLMLATTIIVIVSRFVLIFPAVYLMSFSPRHRKEAKPPVSIPLVLSWIGMRGVVSLAAALALPYSFPGRDLIELATFGVILVTVLIQGTAIGPLVRRLRMSSIVETDKTLSKDATYAHIMAASAAFLESATDPVTGEKPSLALTENYRARVAATARLLTETEAFRPEVTAHFEMALRAVGIGRLELLKLHHEGSIHDSILHTIELRLDLEELHLLTLLDRGSSDH